MAAVPPPSNTLALKLDGPVLHLTLNRPDARNAMSAEMVGELIAVFEAIRNDRAVRAVVLSGAGGSFCAGGDIKDFAAAHAAPPGPGEPDPVRTRNRRFGELLALINGAPQAVVAVVEGAAMGGGFGLACVTDVTIVKADARFAMTETSLGLPPAQIAPYVVARLGITAARRLGVGGARLSGVEAHAIGLAHRVAADDIDMQRVLHEELTRILACAPAAIATTKALMLAAVDQAPELLADAAADAFVTALRGPEGQEGTRAFIEKRKPIWAIAP